MIGFWMVGVLTAVLIGSVAGVATSSLVGKRVTQTKGLVLVAALSVVYHAIAAFGVETHAMHFLVFTILVPLGVPCGSGSGFGNPAFVLAILAQATLTALSGMGIYWVVNRERGRQPRGGGYIRPTTDPESTLRTVAIIKTDRKPIKEQLADWGAHQKANPSSTVPYSTLIPYANDNRMKATPQSAFVFILTCLAASSFLFVALTILPDAFFRDSEGWSAMIFQWMIGPLIAGGTFFCCLVPSIILVRKHRSSRLDKISLSVSSVLVVTVVLLCIFAEAFRKWFIFKTFEW